MKKALHLLIPLILPCLVLSQTYFSNRYTLDGPNSFDFCDEVLIVEQGYLIPGGFDKDDTYNQLGLLVIDTLGNKISVKIYGDQTYSYNFSYTQGGFRQVNDNYYSVGMKPLHLLTTNQLCTNLVQMATNFTTKTLRRHLKPVEPLQLAS